MTAPQPAAPGSDSVHAQIAETLGRHQTTRGMRVSMGWTCACGWWSKDQSPAFIVAHQVDALVSLVDRLRAEAKAEALDEARRHACCAADEHRLRVRRDRAAAYRTNPSSEETQRGE